MSDQNRSIYEQRHVLFCDILGFSRAILDQEIHPSKFLIAFHHLKRAVDEANRQYNPDALDPETGRGYDYIVRAKAQHFSDCFVISTPATNVDAIWLCEAAAEVQNMLVKRGFLCRGAICTGLLHHAEAGIFGPAFITAVCREKAAIWPRIEVSNETLEYFRYGETEQDREICRIREQQLISVDDDFSRIDPFHRLKFFVKHSKPPPHKFVQPLVNAWRKTIARGLSNSDERVRAKYVWMAMRFNESLSLDGCWIAPIETSSV